MQDTQNKTNSIRIELPSQTASLTMIVITELLKGTLPLSELQRCFESQPKL